MDTINDIAIYLAKRIEGALAQDFMPKLSAKESPAASDTVNLSLPPSFYHTRRAIVRALEESIELFSGEQVESDYMLEQMPEKALMDYRNQLKERQAAELARAMLENPDISDKWMYAPKNSDGYAAYRNTRTTFAVIKLGKIKREEQ